MSAFEDMLIRRAEAANRYARPAPTPSATDYTMETLQYILSYIKEHPDCKHSAICGVDREGQKRRSDALRYLVGTGVIVRSPKRPWRYSMRETTNV